jgi:hypothetical protein
VSREETDTTLVTIFSTYNCRLFIVAPTTNVIYVDLEHRTMNRQGSYIPPVKISGRLRLDKSKGFQLRYKMTCILDVLQCG